MLLKHQEVYNGLYHVWMRKYAHAANVASVFTGELKPHVRDALPTLSKRWLKNTSLYAHHVIGHLEHMFQI